MAKGLLNAFGVFLSHNWAVHAQKETLDTGSNHVNQVFLDQWYFSYQIRLFNHWAWLRVE